MKPREQQKGQDRRRPLQFFEAERGKVTAARVDVGAASLETSHSAFHPQTHLWLAVSGVGGGQEGKDGCGHVGGWGGSPGSSSLRYCHGYLWNLIKTLSPRGPLWTHLLWLAGEKPWAWGGWAGEWGKVLISIGDKGGWERSMGGGVPSCLRDFLKEERMV